MRTDMLHRTIDELMEMMPWIEDYLSSFAIDPSQFGRTKLENLGSILTEEYFEERGSDYQTFIDGFFLFIEQVKVLQEGNVLTVGSLTVLPGHNKNGEKEEFSVELKKGEVTAIVGPTGSGKSRLLADIESLAQEDTPTKRRILINGRAPDDEERFSTEGRFIAQLSQNMNFVMDLSVEDFLTLHAESRMVDEISHIVQKIYDTANVLAGESFSRETPVTQLSGGQSRALMIADTALLSPASVVLIDEIENAGVDKVRSLELLVSNNKIVLISTHDPLLALSADQRIVIKNGGISKLMKTTDDEKKHLESLEKIDRKITQLRDQLRTGKEIDMSDLLA
ncbi:ATP-binding cassette domain-containing protein [Methanolobus profundi]|uniref:ABC-type lipoprotein export system, ATPase component n=1 Tax=Methanolobus profundi TaxID=487685 RepID=A0A1I4PLM5_9EURY|nr:ABC transporter ATP-binding protein [Methanolobus profundi]SFM28506.1 ABC-type lipoprotein export system, ATPase component [Methanolobus profundi]